MNHQHQNWREECFARQSYNLSMKNVQGDIICASVCTNASDSEPYWAILSSMGATTELLHLF